MLNSPYSVYLNKWQHGREEPNKYKERDKKNEEDKEDLNDFKQVVVVGVSWPGLTDLQSILGCTENRLVQWPPTFCMTRTS